jgi:hypothetical protein
MQKPGYNDRVNHVGPRQEFTGCIGDTSIPALERALNAVKDMDTFVVVGVGRLIRMRPRHRLLAAMRTLLSQLMDRDVDNVGGDGLDASEYKLLLAMHTDSSIPSDVLGTVHALMCISERAKLLGDWKETIKQRALQVAHHIEELQ